MRLCNSSQVLWIGIILVSSLCLTCYAYPDSRTYEYPSYLIIQEKSAIQDDDSALVSTDGGQFSSKEQLTHDLDSSTKKQVSISTDNLKVVERQISETSVDDDSNEEEVIETQEKLLDDLPQTIIRTVDEKDTELLPESNQPPYVEQPDLITRVSGALQNPAFWSRLADGFSQSSISQALRSFLGFTTTEVSEINENSLRAKRHSSSRLHASASENVQLSSPSTTINGILQQFLPATVTSTQQNEMATSVNDATNELQNLLNQIRTACNNIRDISTSPSISSSGLQSYQNSGILQSAPVLIQNLLDNPEQIGQIPDILQSCIPSTQISDSTEKLRGSLKKIFNILQDLNSDTEDCECEAENTEESRSCCKRKRIQRVNNRLDGWKCKKKRKKGRRRNQSHDNSNQNSQKRAPNTMIVTVPTAVPVTIPYPSSDPNPHTNINLAQANNLHSAINSLNAQVRSTTPLLNTPQPNYSSLPNSNVNLAQTNRLNGAINTLNKQANSATPLSSSYQSNYSSKPHSNSNLSQANRLNSALNTVNVQASSGTQLLNSPQPNYSPLPDSNINSAQANRLNNVMNTLNTQTSSTSYLLNTPQPTYSPLSSSAKYSSISQYPYSDPSTALNQPVQVQYANQRPAPSLVSTNAQTAVSGSSNYISSATSASTASTAYQASGAPLASPTSAATSAVSSATSQVVQQGVIHPVQPVYTRPFLCESNLQPTATLYNTPAPSPITVATTSSTTSTKSVAEASTTAVVSAPAQVPIESTGAVSTSTSQIVQQQELQPVYIQPYSHVSNPQDATSYISSLNIQYPASERTTILTAGNAQLHQGHSKKRRSKSKIHSAKVKHERHPSHIPEPCPPLPIYVPVETNEPTTPPPPNSPPLTTPPPHTTPTPPPSPPPSPPLPPPSPLPPPPLPPTQITYYTPPQPSPMQICVPSPPTVYSYASPSPASPPPPLCPACYTPAPCYCTTSVTTDTSPPPSSLPLPAPLPPSVPLPPPSASPPSVPSPPSPPSPPLYTTEQPEQHKSHEHSKGKGKLGKLLNPRTKRSIRSNGRRLCSDILDESKDASGPDLQILQINVPLPVQLQQVAYSNTDQSSVPCLPVNLPSGFTGASGGTGFSYAPQPLPLTQSAWPSPPLPPSTPSPPPTTVLPPPPQEPNNPIDGYPLDKLSSTTSAIADVLTEISSIIGYNTPILTNNGENSGRQNYPLYSSATAPESNYGYIPGDPSLSGISIPTYSKPPAPESSYEFTSNDRIVHSGVPSPPNSYLQTNRGSNNQGTDSVYGYIPRSETVLPHAQSNSEIPDFKEYNALGNPSIDYTQSNGFMPGSPSNSFVVQSPLQKFSSAFSSVANVLTDATSFINPILHDGQPSLLKSDDSAPGAVHEAPDVSSYATSDSTGESQLGKFRNTISGVADIASDASSLLLPNSSDGRSPLEKLGNTLPSVANVLGDVTSLIMPISNNDGSPTENNNSGSETPLQKFGEAFSSMSSLITPNSNNNGSPSEKIGSDSESPLQKFGDAFLSIADVLKDASSHISSNSNDIKSPLGKTDNSVPNANHPASVVASLTTPNFDSGSPLGKLGNTIYNVADIVSDTSSFLLQSSSDERSPKEKSGNTVSNIAGALPTTNSLYISNPETSGDGSTTVTENLQVPQSLLDKKSPLNEAATAIADSVSAAASLLNSRLQQRRQLAMNKLASQLDNPASQPETLDFANSPISSSLSSLCNSAASVADSLSSAISQLASQRNAVPSPIPVSLPPSVQIYRPTSAVASPQVILPRDQICAAINGGSLLPGDVVTIVLNERTALVGKVVDFVSPISFRLANSGNQGLPLQQGNQMWTISSNDCRDAGLQNTLQLIYKDIKSFL